jgi:hypothetical protein
MVIVVRLNATTPLFPPPVPTSRDSTLLHTEGCMQAQPQGR